MVNFLSSSKRKSTYTEHASVTKKKLQRVFTLEACCILHSGIRCTQKFQFNGIFNGIFCTLLNILGMYLYILYRLQRILHTAHTHAIVINLLKSIQKKSRQIVIMLGPLVTLHRNRKYIVRGHSHITSAHFWRFLTPPPPSCQQFYTKMSAYFGNF